MGLIASAKSEASFPPCPAGMAMGRCVWLVDLGSQMSKLYNKLQPRCNIFFEIPEEKYVFDEEKGPEPYLLKIQVTVSLGEKSTLRPFLQNWRGRPFTEAELKAFDLRSIVGKAGLCNIVHSEPRAKDGKVYANVKTVTPLMKGQTCPPQITPSLIYDVSQGRDAVFKSMPSWLQDDIAKCEEWKTPPPPAPSALAHASVENGDPADLLPGEDEVPF